MRSSAPPLLPVFRSNLQGELLAKILLDEHGDSITALARDLHAPVATVQREAERLVQAGILISANVGRARVLAANENNPAVAPLRQLVLVTFGPPHVVAREFGALHGLDQLILYGSWAARHAGQPGPPPGDVDVLLVGKPDPDDVYDAEQRASGSLGRLVHATTVSTAKWDSSELPFLQELRRRPFLTLPVQGAPSDQASA